MKEDLIRFLLISFLGIVFYQILTCYALTLISASLTGILNGTIPLLTILGERFFRKKVLHPKIYAALGLSLTGIIIMTFYDSNGGNAPVLGAAVMLIALIGWVAFTFLSEKLFLRYSEVEILCYQSFIGALMMTPFLFRNLNALQRQLTYFTNKDIIINMLVLSLGISSLGYLCYMYGLKHIGVGYMGFAMNLLPVFAMFGAFIVLNEIISTTDWIGVGLIVSSVTLAKKDSEKIKLTRIKFRNIIKLLIKKLGLERFALIDLTFLCTNPVF